MGKRTGSADLPLHGGRVPAWLGERMTRLGRVLTEAVILHYGRDEFLRRLAHPFWFQSFGAVMGMDWHSSGITTSVMGALKRGLAPLERERGLYVCGDAQARRLEDAGEDADFARLLAQEKRRSPELGGRTVFGAAGAPRRPARDRRTEDAERGARQLVLPGLGHDQK